MRSQVFTSTGSCQTEKISTTENDRDEAMHRSHLVLVPRDRRRFMGSNGVFKSFLSDHQ